MANEKKGAIERFAESAFMKKLQVGSQTLASNEIFSTISGVLPIKNSSVPTGPGAMAVTEMSRPRSSLAKMAVMVSMAALVAA